MTPASANPAGAHAPGAATDVSGLAEERATGRFELDEWGYDPSLVRAVDPLVRLRWHVDVEVARPSAPALPRVGPALVVYSRAVGISEGAVVSVGLSRATGRTVRVVGAPDVAPLGWWARRLGAVAGQPDEVRGLLAAGAVVAAPFGCSPFRPRRAGPAPSTLVALALQMDVPIVAVATVGTEPGRRWRLRVAEPLEVPGPRGPRGPAAVADGHRAGNGLPVSEDVLDEVCRRLRERTSALLG